MDISTVVQSTPENIASKKSDQALTHVLARVERDIVSPLDEIATNSRPDETNGEMAILTMYTGICFNSPKLFFPKAERKILVVPVKKY